MDLNSIAEFVKAYIIDHWPFLLVSMMLGMVGVFARSYLWTKEAAAKRRFHYWMRATLPFHPVVAGGVFGFVGELLFNGEMIVGPGVERTAASIGLYYAGAGLLSTWIWAAWKHLMKSRGIAPDDPYRAPEAWETGRR